LRSRKYPATKTRRRTRMLERTRRSTRMREAGLPSRLSGLCGNALPSRRRDFDPRPVRVHRPRDEVEAPDEAEVGFRLEVILLARLQVVRLDERDAVQLRHEAAHHHGVVR